MILSLSYFVTTVEEGEIRKAAQRLFITEQALSKHIKKLEKELGIPLLERTRPLKVTPAGKIVYKEAVAMLRHRDRMLKDIEELKGKKTLKIGVFSFGVPIFFSNLLPLMKEAYPGLEIELVMVADLRFFAKMQADIYLLPEPEEGEMQYRILAKDRICVAVSDRLLAEEFGKKKSRVIKEMRETGDIGLLRRIPYLECLDTFRKKLEKSVAFEKTLRELVNAQTAFKDNAKKQIPYLLAQADDLERYMKR